MQKTERVKEGILHCFYEECRACPYNDSDSNCKDVLRSEFESLDLVEKKKKIEFIPGKRAGVKEDPSMEGIIEVRPGTKGIDLGENKYAMAYIRVLDEKHYFKGMCVYSDHLPEDYDVIYYFRDPYHGLAALKTITPEIEISNDIMTKITDMDCYKRFLAGQRDWSEKFEREI